jgi:hypothetical protein
MCENLVAIVVIKFITELLLLLLLQRLDVVSRRQ